MELYTLVKSPVVFSKKKSWNQVIFDLSFHALFLQELLFSNLSSNIRKGYFGRHRARNKSNIKLHLLLLICPRILIPKLKCSGVGMGGGWDGFPIYLPASLSTHTKLKALFRK